MFDVHTKNTLEVKKERNFGSNNFIFINIEHKVAFGKIISTEAKYARTTKHAILSMRKYMF